MMKALVQCAERKSYTLFRAVHQLFRLDEQDLKRRLHFDAHEGGGIGGVGFVGAIVRELSLQGVAGGDVEIPVVDRAVGGADGGSDFGVFDHAATGRLVIGREQGIGVGVGFVRTRQ